MRQLTTLMIAATMASAVSAQTPAPGRAPSPMGTASIQVGMWKSDDKPGVRIADGKWIDVTYGRPLKRGRADLFGSGSEYGKMLKGGAAVWRAGANTLTRFKTEVPLKFGTRTLPAGEYAAFVDLKDANNWTLVLSTQLLPPTEQLAERIKQWDAFVYQPGKDVLRVPMKVESLPYSVEALTYAFTDVTGPSGTLRLMWDTVMASVPFTMAK